MSLLCFVSKQHIVYLVYLALMIIIMIIITLTLTLLLLLLLLLIIIIRITIIYVRDLLVIHTTGNTCSDGSPLHLALTIIVYVF